MLKAENLDPEVPVPLREVGETPASGRLSHPPFPFLPVPWGAGIARGAWGETRQVRSPPSQRQRLRPSSPQLRAGLPLGQPRRRPLGYPCVPSGPEARGLPPLTFSVGQWTCGSPAPLCAQLWLQSNDAHLHSCLHLTFFPWLLHHHCRDFFNTDTFNPLLTDRLHLVPKPSVSLPVCLSVSPICFSISPAFSLASLSVCGAPNFWLSISSLSFSSSSPPFPVSRSFPLPVCHPYPSCYSSCLSVSPPGSILPLGVAE